MVIAEPIKVDPRQAIGTPGGPCSLSMRIGQTGQSRQFPGQQTITIASFVAVARPIQLMGRLPAASRRATRFLTEKTNVNVQRFLAIVALALTAAAVYGGPLQTCPDCGCPQPARRVCRVVPDVQPVTTYEYFSRSETFCVPGRSHCLAVEPSPACDPTTDCGKAAKPHCEKVWVPSAGPVYCRTKLCRRPVTVQKLGYKYIVEDVCCGCGQARINQASTEALQFARGLPPGSWQPLDERPSLVARPSAAKTDAKVQPAAFRDFKPNLESTLIPLAPNH